MLFQVYCLLSTTDSNVFASLLFASPICPTDQFSLFCDSFFLYTSHLDYPSSGPNPDSYDGFWLWALHTVEDWCFILRTSSSWGMALLSNLSIIKIHNLGVPLGQFKVCLHQLQVETDHHIPSPKWICQVYHLWDMKLKDHFILWPPACCDIRARFHCLYRKSRTQPEVSSSPGSTQDKPY